MPGDDKGFDTYVPLKVSILGHHKLLRLRRMAGLKHKRDAVGVVATLFLETLKRDWQGGDLSKYDPLDIEEFLEWDGEPGGLIKALQECGGYNEDTKEIEPGFLIGLRVNDWGVHAKRLIDQRVGRRERYDRTRAPGTEEPRPRRPEVDAKKKADEVLAARQRRG